MRSDAPRHSKMARLCFGKHEAVQQERRLDRQVKGAAMLVALAVRLLSRQ